MLKRIISALSLNTNSNTLGYGKLNNVIRTINCNELIIPQMSCMDEARKMLIAMFPITRVPTEVFVINEINP